MATFFISPAASRGADLKDVISGKVCPLSVKPGDLKKEWQRFTLSTAGTANGNISISLTVSGSSGGNSGSSQNNVADLPGNRSYVTTGQTVSAGGQVYLVAYRLPGSSLDLSALVQSLAAKSPPPANILTSETALPLSLLDLRSAGSLENIRPFDLQREIEESEKLWRTIAAALKSAGGEKTKNSPATSPEEKKP